MTIYKISLSDAQADKLANWLSRTTGKVDSRIAEEIRAQIPKPPDPIEDLVQEFANRDWPVGDADDARLRYFITPARLREFAAAVLRAGIGQPEPLAQWETELLNQQERREVASAVLSAMDVDQYLIDAVANARPR